MQNTEKEFWRLSWLCFSVSTTSANPRNLIQNNSSQHTFIIKIHNMRVRRWVLNHITCTSVWLEVIYNWARSPLQRRDGLYFLWKKRYLNTDSSFDERKSCPTDWLFRMGDTFLLLCGSCCDLILMTWINFCCLKTMHTTASYCKLEVTECPCCPLSWA